MDVLSESANLGVHIRSSLSMSLEVPLTVTCVLQKPKKKGIIKDVVKHGAGGELVYDGVNGCKMGF